MIRRLLAALFALSFVLPTPVLAGGQTQGFCEPWHDPHARFYENRINDTSDGNDYIDICFKVSNLSDLDHRPAGNCNDGGLFGSYSWNDCGSSIALWLPDDRWKVCIYSDSGYRRWTELFKGPKNGQRYNLYINDVASSLYIGSGSCPMN